MDGMNSFPAIMFFKNSTALPDKMYCLTGIIEKTNFEFTVYIT